MRKKREIFSTLQGKENYCVQFGVFPPLPSRLDTERIFPEQREREREEDNTSSQEKNRFPPSFSSVKRRGFGCGIKKGEKKRISHRITGMS